ncbi:phosphoenolpyruvate--protein phosphotransferase [Actinomadura craniellae]|uniref:phosphoenolpyruvate--protein phosphotransferase n=1 Tax=Actinomadura craniellae TaxID=2231787 RepID=UPI0022780037|nr:phosphoenolpyruvate--protein phosphotransferase [Actinomadura craniellae]
MAAPDLLRGLPAAPGSAAGPVLPMGRPPALPAPRAVTDPEQEIAAAVAALDRVHADLSARSAAARPGPARDILAAQAAIAADPDLRAGVLARVMAGEDAAHALRHAVDEHRRAFLVAGGRLAERAADLDDIAHRAVAGLLGLPMPGVPDPGHPFILVADDLSPADTASLDPAVVLALVTERGGPTCHTAILARALGLPAVVGCAGALAAATPARLAVVDGGTGHVRFGVAKHEIAAVRAAAPPARPAPGRGPGRTADGHPVELMLNIGSAADLAGLDVTGVPGVGLFRTEFLFLDRWTEPAEDEQAAAYAEVFAAFGHGRVTVRTLDAGADKPLPFLDLPEEANPALGLRGLRTARRRPDVLDTQLRAIARAAATAPAEVTVLAPMVSTPREAADFAARARRHGLARVGVMVEVPAAALLADRLLESVDLLNVGTNDLAQYALAADRHSGDLPDLLDPWQPALLHLVARCAEAGRRAGKPVCVCGEAAADPLLAPVLVGLGVTRLSMSARALPAVRANLARYDLAECRRMAGRALSASDAAQARTRAGSG